MKCHCHGTVCHSATAGVTLVPMPSRTGGPTVNVPMSDECNGRFHAGVRGLDHASIRANIRAIVAFCGTPRPVDADVPASTRIRTRSLPNVTTDRLRRRLAWFRDTDHRAFLAGLENRRPMRDLAREILNVERELARREAT